MRNCDYTYRVRDQLSVVFVGLKQRDRSKLAHSPIALLSTVESSCSLFNQPLEFLLLPQCLQPRLDALSELSGAEGLMKQSSQPVARTSEESDRTLSK